MAAQNVLNLGYYGTWQLYEGILEKENQKE